MNINATNEVNKTTLNLNDVPGFVNVNDCSKFTLVILPNDPPENFNEFSQEFFKQIDSDCNVTFLSAYIAIGTIFGLILVALLVAAIVFYRRKKKANEQEQEEEGS